MKELQRTVAFASFALPIHVACAAPPAAAPARAPATRAAAGAPRPQAAVDPRAELEAKIDPIFADFAHEGSPGCAVGVYRAGEIAFSKGYGCADMEHDAPITDTTPFYTASLSKQFTAAAVLLLAADGKVSLEDDVRRYVPELPDFGGARITLDHLLHHTSGLRDYHLLLLLDGLNEEDVITSREILWLLDHQRTLGFPPGSRFSYSSSGYVLLAEIVARVSGESFHAFLTRRVLQPLGMRSSLVREDHARLIPHRAIGYTLGPDKQLRSLMGNLEYDGSSNFVTTIRDLARWDANFYDPRVGGQALIDAMRVRGRLADGTVLDYAMGLEELETHGLPVERHDGGFAGYRTVLLRYPTERLTVSVLCNTTEANPDALGDEVAEVFLPQLRAPEPEAAPPASEAPAPFRFDLATVAGTYIDMATGESRTVDAAGGSLRMRYGRSSAAPRELVPAGPADLLVKGSHTRYQYEPAKGKRAAQLVRIAKADAPRTFVRAEPVDKVEGLAEYSARFGSDELAHDLEIRVEDGHLVAAAVGGARRSKPFTPVARDLFATDDEGWRFERDARGKIVRLVASSDRARGVVLIRR
jgi:CubicO group peptidase (beta-lactamase class C family)